MERLRKLVVSIFICCFALEWGAVPVTAEPAAAAAKPIASVADPVFDFGSVFEGTKVVHDFVIRNTGSADLVVQRVMPACGCTVSTVMPTTIAPGMSGTVHVEFDTDGFSGDKLKTVRLYTNDIDQPSTMVTLRGRIESEVQIQPQRIYFGEIVRGAAPQQLVEVTVRGRSKARITGVKAYSDHVLITELRGDESAKKFNVSLSPDVPLGEIRDRIVISLSGASSSAINVPIWGMITGAVRIKPSSVSFGVLAEGKGLVRTVRVENVGKEPVMIRGVSSSSPAVQGSIKAIEEGRLYEVSVSVDPSKVQKDLRAALELQTSSKQQPTISLSVYGTLPPVVRSTKR